MFVALSVQFFAFSFFAFAPSASTLLMPVDGRLLLAKPWGWRYTARRRIQDDMKLRRLLFGLLTILLLSAQQAALAHGVSHTGKPPPAKEQLAHSNLCGKCVGFEKLTHAVPGSAVAVLSLDLIFRQPVGARHFFRPRQAAAFHSRAPPVLL